MVDFRMHMSPQERARFDAMQVETQRYAEMTPEAFIAVAVHVLSNATRPTLPPVSPLTGGLYGGLTYNIIRDHILIAEMVKRLNYGVLPTKCPICGSIVDLT